MPLFKVIEIETNFYAFQFSLIFCYALFLMLFIKFLTWSGLFYFILNPVFTPIT